jgi:Protein of unknown function (DUF2934)
MSASETRTSHRPAQGTPNVCDSNSLRAHAVPHIPIDRRACIAAAAYEMAERRGFAAGHEFDDWLQAEAQVDARLIGEGRVF